jgi:hypothetical protein
MDERAPGAAEAARSISRGNLSDIERRRVERLTSDATKRAWLEVLHQREKSKRKLSETELWAAQHELMWEAYRAPDFTPIGPAEIEQSKARLVKIGEDAANLAGDIGDIGNDAQLAGMWLAYRNNRINDAILRVLPSDLTLVAAALYRVEDFFQRAAELYKPEGPVTPVGQPGDLKALKTTVIRQIAHVCQKHFGTPMYSTVATLAKASLDRTDIDRETVKGSLRNTRQTVA